MNLRTAWITLLVLLVAGTLAPAQEEEAKTPLEAARALKDEGEYEKARTLLLTAIEKDPNDAELILEVGKVNHLQGRDLLSSNASLGRLALYDAKTWYQKALEKRPEWPEALQLLGSVATELGDLETAADAWKRACALSPDNGECRYQLGYCLGLLGRFEEAVVAFKEAIKLLGPDPRVLLNQGICHLNLKQVSEAESCLTTLIRGEVAAGRQGGDSMNRGVLWLWRLHSRENRYARAEEVFAGLAKDLPKVSALHWYVGHARLRQGNARGAAMAFTTVTELIPAWSAGWRQLGSAQVSTGEYGAAADALVALVRLDPGGQSPQELLFEIVTALKNEGRPEEALALVGRFLPSFPGDSLVLEVRGDLHYSAGEMAKAIVDYRKALEIDSFAQDPAIKAQKAATALLRTGKVPAELQPIREPAQEEKPRAEPEWILDFERPEIFVRANGKVDGRRKDGRFMATRTGTANEFANVSITFIPTMDTRMYTTLDFDVKGPKGTTLVVRAKDCYDEFGMNERFLRLVHKTTVDLSGEWQQVSLPLDGFVSVFDNRPIPMNRSRLRAITFQIGQTGGAEINLANEILLDNVSISPADGAVFEVANFDRQPEETLFISEGAASAFARTLFTPEQVKTFRPEANTYVTPAIFGEDFDKSFVNRGEGAFRLTLVREGAASGALTFNPDRSYERATALVFWARGVEGGEKVRVTIEDAMDTDLGNGAPAAAPRMIVAGKMLEGWFSLSPEWRKYRIPRSSFPDVNFDALLALRFHFGTPQGNARGTTIFIDDIGWE